ncbi:unnamed protein product [Lactuca saligna]|uniref:Uncharacterized protein n=1 Tax=Lactuca saligna TaxID=75948 RepID=A0AA35YSK1_LACSI|nr:unnamed protein product [Lactuca saligna]
MAESSSVHDISVRQPLLTIKPQQNLIIDLTPFVYEPYMLYVVECLKYSPLVDVLTKVEIVPMSFLSHVYSTTFYDKANERIHFELHDEKVSISKSRLCALIGLSQDSSLVNPDSITTGQLFTMFYQMRYTETLTTVTKFKKSCLPPQWNVLFTLLFKGLSERSAGFDAVSKAFMTVMYGLYNWLNLDYGTIIWQQLVQSLLSSSKHSEISCGQFWTIITKWAMDRNRVPIMADSLISSIATFHTTKIIITDPTKFSYIGSIPETMLGCISASSNLLQQYRKRKAVGPRELTPSMLHSIEEADKPAKRGKKPESQKEGPVAKPSKGQTPKKRKTDQPAPSQPQPKNQKKPARRLILQSSSDLDSEYVPPKHKHALTTDSKNESSDEEASGRGDTPLRSLSQDIPVRSLPPSPPHATIRASIPPISQTTTFQPFTSIPIPTPIFTDTTSTTTTKPTFTIPKPPAAAAKNAATVTSSVETLQQTLQSECSKVDVARNAIQQANEAFHANVNEHLSQLQKDLAMENGLMDELSRRTNQLKLQTHKLRSAHAEIDDLKSEREIIRTSAADIHSILLHLIDGHDTLVTTTTRRHLADKLRPDLDVLSRIEGVPVAGVQPQQGGEKAFKQEKQEMNQPRPSSSKPAAEPKVNEASVSNKEKKKKKIGEDDTDNEDDVYFEVPTKLVPKEAPSQKQTEEISMKQRAELEKKRKEP